MSEIVKEIELTEEDCVRLEKAFYEYTTIKDNIAYLLYLHRDEPDYIESRAFVEYQNKEVEKNIAYENIKNEITIKYIPVEILESSKYQWNANFPENKLVITEI